MWLYVPSNSLPEAEDSPSDWKLSALARSVSWRGKLSPPRLWCARWSKVAWLRALSGRMSPPSTANRGVESWISSLAASPVRTCPTPGSEQASTGSGRGSGLSSLGSWARYDPATSSWRTSQLSLLEGLTESSETWPRWGSMRSGVVWARTTPELPTVESGSSSWPTPSASLPNDAEEPETFFARAETVQARSKNGNGMGTPLAIAAKLWPTPQAYGSGKEGNSMPGLTPLDLAARPEVCPGYRGRPDREMPTDGAPTSRAPRVLNPRFVEALMGWPDGWTDCASWETESSPTKQPSPSASCGSDSMRETEAA